MTTPKSEIQFLVLPNSAAPFLLARVRWPDVYQAISPARPDWQDDPGLFDLPYAQASTRVTFERATQIAAEWGARLPSGDEDQAPGPTLIRRMPSDWSNLSAAERRAWSIEVDRTDRVVGSARHAAVAATTSVDLLAGRQASTRRSWGRRRVKPVSVEWSALFDDPIPDDVTDAALAVEMTQPIEAVRATAEHT